MEKLDESIANMLLHLQTDDPDTYKACLDKIKELDIEIDDVLKDSDTSQV